MADETPLNHLNEMPSVLQAMSSVHKAMDGMGIDRKLQHLVWLRASQINGCAYCVKMHTREAREDGETNDRLDRLVVWHDVDDFTDREKAAFAWTEALTGLQRPSEIATLRASLREHMTDREISLLTASVAMINLWNRIQISSH